MKSPIFPYGFISLNSLVSLSFKGFILYNIDNVLNVILLC
jgi:hypothetical protein